MRGLELSPDKTAINHISDGFDFLGQNIRKYSGKLLITPSKKNTQAVLHKLRTITENPFASIWSKSIPRSKSPAATRDPFAFLS